MIITAADGGTPSLSSSTFVTISIMDENDNAPQFARQSYTVTLPENSPNGALVIDLEATDADSGSNSQLVYSIVGGSSIFQIQPGSGIMTVLRSGALDYEVQRRHILQVQVQDSGTPQLSTSTLVGLLLSLPC